MEIKAATSSALVEAACRLRYDVFVEEMGDRRYANDDRRLHVDSFDHPGDNIYVAIDCQKVVGTLRLIVCQDGPYIQEELCGYPELAAILGIQQEQLLLHAGFTTRCAVAMSHRGQGLFSLLQDHLEIDARRRNLRYIISVVAEHNDPSYALFTKRGFFKYHQATFANGWVGKCICKIL